MDGWIDIDRHSDTQIEGKTDKIKIKKQIETTVRQKYRLEKRI